MNIRKPLAAISKKIAAVFLTLTTLIMPLNVSSALTYRDIQSFLPGNPLISETRTVSNGIIYNSWKGYNDSRKPVVLNTLTVNTLNPETKAIVWSGSSLTERNTLSSMITAARDKGMNVVGGVNGDFFNTATGAPLGIVMRNGIIYSSDGGSYYGLGFRQDGSSVMGKPSIQFSLFKNGNYMSKFHFNKDQSNNGPHIYSTIYGPKAGSNQIGVDVVVEFPTTHLYIGTVLEGIVKEVRLDAQNTPIEPNQMIISARTDKNGYLELSTSVPGDIIRLEVADPTGQWSGVQEAIGGLQSLFQNGLPIPDLSSTNMNPATIIGKKADESLVTLQIDGRQSAWSNGVSYAEAARLMMQLGCVDAMVFDGGGSSTFYLRSPGDYFTHLGNKPSDGSERQVTNALLFVSTTPASGQIKENNMLPSELTGLLHLYPEKRYILPGATTSWLVKSTDFGYTPTDVPGGIQWMSTGGVFSPDGKMQVQAAPGYYSVFATVGAASGSASFIVPDHLSEIHVSKDQVVAFAGEVIDLNATGVLEGAVIDGLDSSYQWIVDPSVGTITQDGVFTAANAPEASGSINVSWGATSRSIPVYIARNPMDIEAFESTTGWSFKNIRNSKSAARAVIDENIAVFGTGLLRVYYNFKSQSESDKGAAGIEVGPAGPADSNGESTIIPIPLEGTPTGIGMWVNGNKGYNWLRGKLTDATGKIFDLDYTSDYKPDTKTGGIDWAGWKYVEASIPKTAIAPYTLTVPIRVMCTREEMKDVGYLLFDRLRAVYGASNDDMTAPSVTSVYPEDNSVVNDGAVAFRITAKDDVNGTLINPNKVALYLDGEKIEFQLQQNPLDMLIMTLTDTKKPLAGGEHLAKVKIEDHFGNKTVKNWSFHVDTKTPQISLEVPEDIAAGEIFEAVIRVKNPNPLKTISLNMNWNSSELTIMDLNAKKTGIQIGTEKWVSDAKITKEAINSQAGTLNFSVTGLNSTIKATERDMIRVQFRAKPSTNGRTVINGTQSVMKTVPLNLEQSFSLVNKSISVVPLYTLDVSNVVQGGIAKFSVVDRNGSPVEGASIYVNESGKSPFAKTGVNGTVDSKALGVLPAGTKINLRASKANLASTTVPVVVSAKASEGSIKPLAVSISPISQPGGMSIHWLSENPSGATAAVIESALYNGVFSQQALSVNAGNTKTNVINPKTKGTLYEHKAVFYGLKSGTQYQWQITDGKNGSSDAGVFRTPVSGKPETFTFGFVTDPQAVSLKGYAPFTDTMQRMIGKNPELSFVMFGGDMVDNGSLPEQWWGLFNASETLFSRIPTFTVPGNHEYKNDGKLLNYKAFWGMPATGPSGFAETSYTVENGAARFYMLDTQGNLDVQLKWLKKEKAASDSQWDIVVMHRGIYGGFYDESSFRKIIAPVFDELGIDLVLSGHDHTYLRTTMKAGKKVLPGTGTSYIAGGASGGKFYDAKKQSWTDVLYDGNTPSFTLITVSPEKMIISASHVEKTKTVKHDMFTIESVQ